MKNFSHQYITITRSEDAQVELKEKLIIGDLNKLACGSVDRISESIINIFNELGAKTQSQPFFDIDKSLVGTKITVSENLNLDIEKITNSFLLHIQSSNESAHLMFDQISNSEEQVVRDETRKFLSQNGNRQIKVGIQISAGELSINLAGKYGQNKIEILEDEPPETLYANIDGILNKKRFVSLEINCNKYMNAYFDEINFFKLRKLYFSQQKAKFTTQIRYDAMGRKDNYVIYIDDTETSITDLENNLI